MVRKTPSTTFNNATEDGAGGKDIEESGAHCPPRCKATARVCDILQSRVKYPSLDNCH